MLICIYSNLFMVFQCLFEYKSAGFHAFVIGSPLAIRSDYTFLKSIFMRSSQFIWAKWLGRYWKIALNRKIVCAHETQRGFFHYQQTLWFKA